MATPELRLLVANGSQKKIDSIQSAAPPEVQVLHFPNQVDEKGIIVPLDPNAMHRYPIGKARGKLEALFGRGGWNLIRDYYRQQGVDIDDDVRTVIAANDVVNYSHDGEVLEKPEKRLFTFWKQNVLSWTGQPTHIASGWVWLEDGQPIEKAQEFGVVAHIPFGDFQDAELSRLIAKDGWSQGICSVACGISFVTAPGFYDLGSNVFVDVYPPKSEPTLNNHLGSVQELSRPERCGVVFGMNNVLIEAMKGTDPLPRQVVLYQAP